MINTYTIRNLSCGSGPLHNTWTFLQNAPSHGSPIRLPLNAGSRASSVQSGDHRGIHELIYESPEGADNQGPPTQAWAEAKDRPDSGTPGLMHSNWEPPRNVRTDDQACGSSGQLYRKSARIVC